MSTSVECKPVLKSKKRFPNLYLVEFPNFFDEDNYSANSVRKLNLSFPALELTLTAKCNKSTNKMEIALTSVDSPTAKKLTVFIPDLSGNIHKIDMNLLGSFYMGTLILELLKSSSAFPKQTLLLIVSLKSKGSRTTYELAEFMKHWFWGPRTAHNMVHELPTTRYLAL